jgi:UDP-glucose 4-epimerase
MKILVTGCAGLIGSHLVDNLLNEGHIVTGIDDLSYGTLNNLTYATPNQNFKFINDDVRRINQLFKSTKFDIIYHLASIKKPWGDVIKSNTVIDTNYLMTREIVDYSNENNSFLIFTSTSDVYGNSKHFLETEKITIGPPTNERYSYAMSKLISEQFIFNAISQSKLDASVVRIFGCTSERAKPSWSAGHVPLFIYNALNNIDINIHGDGLQTRSISSAEDIARGLLTMADHLNNVKGEIINLGTDQQTTVKEVAEYIVERTASKSNIIYTPREKIFGDYDEIQIRYANTNKARDLIDFKINISTYEIIDSMIESYSNINSKYYVIKS